MTTNIIATAKDEIKMFERPSVATGKKLIARVEELEAEVKALRPIYHHARGLMRHNGVDKHRADSAYDDLQGFTHEATAFYDEQE